MFCITNIPKIYSLHFLINNCFYTKLIISLFCLELIINLLNLINFNIT